MALYSSGASGVGNHPCQDRCMPPLMPLTRCYAHLPCWPRAMARRFPRARGGAGWGATSSGQTGC